MSENPSNANEGCPGVQSESAGRSSACAGCPNQTVCASGAAAKPDPAIQQVAEHLSTIKHKILVLSGKGGVGKSTFSAQLAFTLAARGFEVGLLDIDICGPSIPRMTGLTRASVHQSASGWSPVWVNDNLCVMSIGFMLPSEDDAIIWRGPKKSGLIRQFLTDVDWGHLDFLIIDTPPGTSDEHISIVQYLKEAGVDGALVITTPQEVAMADVRKELSFCSKVGLRVLGVVENMSGFICPCCNTKSAIFPAPASGGPEAMALKMHVPYLGAVPIDPQLLTACEAGEAYVTTYPSAPGVTAFQAVVSRVLEHVSEPETHPSSAASAKGAEGSSASAHAMSDAPAIASGAGAEVPKPEASANSSVASSDDAATLSGR